MKKLKIFILVSTITFSLVLIAKAVSSAGRAIFEGEVGIGTMNPAGKLHVEGPGNVIFNTSGNVGIGTTRPTEKLDVAGKIKARGICIGNDCRTSWPGGGSGSGYWSASGTNIYSTNRGYVGIGTKKPEGVLHVEGIGNVIFNTSGYVGIGTTRPESNLDVVAPVSFRGAYNGRTALYVDLKGNVGIKTTKPAGVLHVTGIGNVLFNPLGNVGIGTTTPNAKLTIQSVNDRQGTLSFFPKGTDISYDGGSDKLFIFAANGGAVTSFMGGKIGIGTPKPTKQLEVNGTMGFSGGKGPFCIFSNVCPSGWVDKGLGGYIYNSRGGATCPYSVGGAYNDSWTWCHPRICCNE